MNHLVPRIQFLLYQSWAIPKPLPHQNKPLIPNTMLRFIYPETDQEKRCPASYSLLQIDDNQKIDNHNSISNSIKETYRCWHSRAAKDLGHKRVKNNRSDYMWSTNRWGTCSCASALLCCHFEAITWSCSTAETNIAWKRVLKWEFTYEDHHHKYPKSMINS